MLDRLSGIGGRLAGRKELQPNQITDLLLELDQVEQQSQNQSDQQHLGNNNLRYTACAVIAGI